MIGRFDPRVFTVRCGVCGGGEFDHDRTTGECDVYRRDEHKPLVYRRRDKTPATGWRVR